MASPIDKMKSQIARGFRGKLRKGTIRREVPGSLDEFGDPVPGSVQTFGFEGIREDLSALYAAQAGIPTTDCKVLGIAGSCEVTPKQGDQVSIEGAWYQCRAVMEIDPAGATWSLQCYGIDAP